MKYAFVLIPLFLASCSLDWSQKAVDVVYVVETTGQATVSYLDHSTGDFVKVESIGTWTKSESIVLPDRMVQVKLDVSVSASSEATVLIYASGAIKAKEVIPAGEKGRALAWATYW